MNVLFATFVNSLFKDYQSKNLDTLLPTRKVPSLLRSSESHEYFHSHYLNNSWSIGHLNNLILHIAVVSRYFLPKYIKEMFITKRCWLTRTRNRTQVYQLIKIHLITFQLVFHLFQEHYSTFVTISWRAALHAVIKHGQRTWLLCGIDTPPDQRCEPVVV